MMPGAVVPAEGPGSKPDLQKMAELVKKVVAENKKGIAEVLKPEQARRFKQIELQFQGIGALQNGDVVKAPHRDWGCTGRRGFSQRDPAQDVIRRTRTLTLLNQRSLPNRPIAPRNSRTSG